MFTHLQHNADSDTTLLSSACFVGPLVATGVQQVPGSFCGHVLETSLLLRLLLLLLLQIRTQPHLGCCLAAATAAASAVFMHLCINSATPYTSPQHMRSCNDVNGNCANRRSRLTTAVAGHGKSRWASSSTGRSCIPKAVIVKRQPGNNLKY
jgi:hypothetical protein